MKNRAPDKGVSLAGRSNRMSCELVRPEAGVRVTESNNCKIAMYSNQSTTVPLRMLEMDRIVVVEMGRKENEVAYLLYSQRDLGPQAVDYRM